jgi:hypothetical protein
MSEVNGTPPGTIPKPDDPPPGPAQAAGRDLTVHDIVKQLKIPDAFKFVGACIAILAGAYALGASHPFSSLNVQSISANTQAIDSKTYYGYYADLKSDGTPTISDETLSFEFLPNAEVKATSTAVVNTKNGRIRLQEGHSISDVVLNPFNERGPDRTRCGPIRS